MADETSRPAAWLHEFRPHSDVITDDVKRLWLRVNPRHVEHYNIPLAPMNSTERKEMKLDVENCSPHEAAARGIEWAAERIKEVARLSGQRFSVSDFLLHADVLRAKERADEKASVDGILEMLPTMLLNGSTQCPLCGQYEVHSHTPGDIIIYRNGVKYGRSAAYGGASKLSESDG